MFETEFKTVLDLIKAFPDEQSCINHLEKILWHKGVVSPFDPTSKVYKCKDNRYRCKNTGKYFNVKTNTMFDNTKVELQKWFLAIWYICSYKKGISSIQLAKELGVTQKTAWFLSQRIRKCFGIENNNELDGVVEADESFYGGKNKNRHADKKIKGSQGRSCIDKVPILGLLQRGGKLTAIVMKNTAPESIQPLVRRFVAPNSHLISDDWKGYKGLNKEYNHFAVKHAGSGFKHDFGKEVHTNNIESSWKVMKNSLRDMYNAVSRKHLQIYVDEFVFRFNLRKMSQTFRFNWLLLNSNVRTKYKELIV